MAEKKIPLKMSYLGDRNYIDITTITDSFYEAISPKFVQNEMKRFDFRIFHPITHQCHAQFFDSPEAARRAQKRDATASFSCVYMGKSYHALLFQEGQEINDRRPGRPFDPSADVLLTKNEIQLLRPFNDGCIFTLMCMGKQLLVSAYHRPPRVVAFHYDRLFDRAEMRAISMELEPKSIKGFTSLLCKKEGQTFGRVTVQLLDA